MASTWPLKGTPASSCRAQRGTGTVGPGGTEGVMPAAQTGVKSGREQSARPLPVAGRPAAPQPLRTRRASLPAHKRVRF